MRRSEKIQRFLEAHPQATERDLQKKFTCSYREAKALLEEYRGEETTEEEETSFWRGLFSDIGLLFASPQRTAIALVGIALFWRFFYLLFFGSNALLQIPLLDAEYYLEWADEIMNQGWLGEQVFFTEPFYAYFLAMLIKLFGRDALALTALGLQFVAGALFPVLLYFLGRDLISERVGRIAGLIAACYGPFLFYDGLFLKTSFEVYSLPLFLFVFWKALEKSRGRLFVLAGLTLGLVVLIKGNSMVFLPVGCGLIFFFLRTLTLKTRVLYSGLFALGVLVCVVPVTVRNYVVSQDIVPTNYSIGLVLYQGNWWGGDGSTARVPSFLRPHPKYEETDAVKMAESYQGRELKASEVSRFWIGKAVDEVLVRPGHFLKSTGHKILLLFNYREYSDNYSYAYYRSQIPFLWVLPGFFWVVILGMGGLWVLWQTSLRETIVQVSSEEQTQKNKSLWRAKWMLVSFFVAYAGVLLLTTINSRYRMPLVPFLILFSSIALSFFYQGWYERTTRGMKQVGAVMLMTIVLVFLPLSLFKHLSFADAYHNIGYWYFTRGEYTDAQIYFQKAIKDDPEYAWSYRSLFQIALLDDRYDDAKKHLQKIIKVRPDDLSVYKEVALLKEVEQLSSREAQQKIDAYIKAKDEVVYDADFYEANRWLEQGDEAKAEEYFQQSLAKQDEPIATLVALASLRTKQGNDGEAESYLKKAIDKNADLFVARYNLANIAIRKNNYQPVAELLAPVYEFAPELGETWYNYAVTLIKTGKTNEAMPVAEAYIERYKSDAARRDKVAKMEEFTKAVQEQQKNNPLPNVTK